MDGSTSDSVSHSLFGPGTDDRSRFHVGGEGLRTETESSHRYVHPENHASINVLHKLGFGEESRPVVMGIIFIVYGLTPGVGQTGQTRRRCRRGQTSPV
jgi:hypothetical protein